MVASRTWSTPIPPSSTTPPHFLLPSRYSLPPPSPPPLSPFVVSMCWGDWGALKKKKLCPPFSSSSCHTSCHCHRHAGSCGSCRYIVFLLLLLFISVLVGCYGCFLAYFLDVSPLSLSSLSPQGCLLSRNRPSNWLKLPCSLASSHEHQHQHPSLSHISSPRLVLESSLASICPLFFFFFFPRHPTSASFPPLPSDSFFHPFSAPLFCPHEYFRRDGRILVSLRLIEST